MIRSTQLILLRKNSYNVSLYCQRASFVSSQALTDVNAIQNMTREEKRKNSVNEPTVRKNISRVQEKKRVNTDNSKHLIFRDILKNNSNYLELKYGNYSRGDNINALIENLPLRNTNEMIKIMKSMALTGKRVKPLLRVLCDFLQSSKHNFTEEQSSDVLFSLAKLNFRHEALIKIIVHHLKNEKNNLGPPIIISSLAQSLAQLHYRDTEFMELLALFLNNHPFNDRISLSFLISNSILNCCPSTIDYMIQSLADLEPVDFIRTQSYIDFIWACVILNKVTAVKNTHLPEVLSTKTLGKIIFGVKGINEGAKLKLLNINGAAAYLPEYGGPTLEEFPQLKLREPNEFKRNLFLESVCDALGHITDKAENMKLNVNTKAGFFLDVECAIQPQLSEINSNKKELKLGVLLLNYSDTCSDGTYTGLFAFKKRILKAMGYTTVVISYKDYPKDAKLYEKILHLQEKITAAISEQ